MQTIPTVRPEGIIPPSSSFEVSNSTMQAPLSASNCNTIATSSLNKPSLGGRPPFEREWNQDGHQAFHSQNRHDSSLGVASNGSLVIAMPSQALNASSRTEGPSASYTLGPAEYQP